ncbi:MAG: hypothetical protein JSU08_17220 [Acidobacteria bacterium]|nr:hypothetical protein [Acidobacteriota bacterium]
MDTLHIDNAPTYADIDWAPFSGGELEAPRPRVLCTACREKRAASTPAAGKPTLCFQCYRAELEKNRRIAAAAELNTASEERFQTSLPFEPVNAARLVQLKAEREAARVKARAGAGAYIERRHRAQIEARHALTRIFQGLKARRLVGQTAGGGIAAAAALAPAARADVQFPEAWLPFVVAR